MFQKYLLYDNSNVILLQSYIDNSFKEETDGERLAMTHLEEHAGKEEERIPVERVQLGVRMEKRMVKVLKGLAEYHDISLGDLLEGIVLHAFENKTPFREETLQRIGQLKEFYGMNYGASAGHRFIEQKQGTDEA